MEEFDIALHDPSCVFAHPKEVLAHEDFSREQKIQILRSWEYDMRELEVAEEENMGGGEPDILDEIHAALLALNAQDDEGHPPTKQS